MSAQPALSDAVFTATMLSSRIVRNAIKAKYGPPAEALVRLAEAKRLVLEVAIKLELAEAAVISEAARAEEAVS